jgi:hypothetical protein
VTGVVPVRILAEDGGNNTGTSGRRKQAKSSQAVLKLLFHNSFSNNNLRLILNHLAVSVSSPEKAGVGGSIPALATMFSTAYKAPLRRFHSISLQNHGARGSSRLEMPECTGVASLSIPPFVFFATALDFGVAFRQCLMGGRRPWRMCRTKTVSPSMVNRIR